jgi:outer membrane usher protein FimD/PapC
MHILSQNQMKVAVAVAAIIGFCGFIPLSYGVVADSPMVSGFSAEAAIKPNSKDQSKSKLLIKANSDSSYRSNPKETSITVLKDKQSESKARLEAELKSKQDDGEKLKKTNKSEQASSLKSQKDNLFDTEPGPPPGFSAAMLDQEQATIVNVVFGGETIGETTASFTASTVQLSNPMVIVDKIPGLTNKKLILKVLQQKLPTHEDNLCVYGDNKPYCKSISPKVAGVIFDPNSYHVYVFINPKYITVAEKKKEALPNSDAGFSSQVQNNLNIAGAKNSQIYSLSNTTVFGYNNSRLLVNSTYTKNIVQHTATDQFQINSFAYGHYNNGVLYQSGMLNTFSSGNFLLSRSILGMSATNGDVDGAPSKYGISSPLSVYLTTRSQVRVLKNGNLIYSTTLPSGKHDLNTAGFPSGSYDVTIIAKGQYGQVVKQIKHFVKETDLPSLDKPIYHASFGLVQDNFAQEEDVDGGAGDINIPTVQTKYSENPILELSQDKSLAYNWGVESSVISNFHKLYLDSGLSYFVGDFALTPELLLSSLKTYGGALDGTFSGDSFNANLLFAKLHSGETVDEINNNDFYPVTTNNLQVQTGVGYSFENGLSVQLTGNWLQNIGSSVVHSYNFSINKMLFSTSSSNMNLNLNATETNEDKIIDLGVTFNFFNNNYLATVTGDYQRNNSSADNGSNESKTTGQASLTRNYKWSPLRNADISASAAQDVQGQTYIASGMYESPEVQTNASITHNVNTDNSGNSTQSTNYTATLASSLAYTNGTFAFGYSQGWYSGVLVNIKSKIPSDVKIYVDGNYAALAETNDPEPIFLQPYKTHQISIIPVGSTLFKYDTGNKSATIYRGNIKYLSWTLAKQFILFAQIVDSKGEPLKNSLLVRKNSFDSTGEYGYLQASITTADKTMKFEYEQGKYCTVNIPKKLKIENGFVQLEKPLVCK